MPRGTAEQHLKNTCDLAFKGNVRGLVDALTSEAYVDLVKIGQALIELPPAESYAIVPLSFDGEDYLFRLTLKNRVSDVEAFATVREIKGDWKVAAIKIPGVRD
jgi:hypothetical protein